MEFQLGVEGANHNDSILLAPTLDNAKRRWRFTHIETIRLDRGSDPATTPERLKERDLTDAIVAKRRKQGGIEPDFPAGTTTVASLGQQARPAALQRRRPTERATRRRL